LILNIQECPYVEQLGSYSISSYLKYRFLEHGIYRVWNFPGLAAGQASFNLEIDAYRINAHWGCTQDTYVQKIG
jgi:hypothetical protein